MNEPITNEFELRLALKLRGKFFDGCQDRAESGNAETDEYRKCHQGLTDVNAQIIDYLNRQPNVFDTSIEEQP